MLDLLIFILPIITAVGLLAWFFRLVHYVFTGRWIP